ncbi:hypothetical protein [Exiguobacterium sp.]|nr:hypothetical protein [Exiguobacterium sp.]
MAKTYAEWLPTSGYELADLPSSSFTKHDGPSIAKSGWRVKRKNWKRHFK